MVRANLLVTTLWKNLLSLQQLRYLRFRLEVVMSNAGKSTLPQLGERSTNPTQKDQPACCNSCLLDTEQIAVDFESFLTGRGDNLEQLSRAVFVVEIMY